MNSQRENETIKYQKGNAGGSTGVAAAVVFLAVIAVCVIISLVKPQSDFSEAENRALQELPEFDWDMLMCGDFQEEYEEYLSDQFIGREFFVSLKTGIERIAGKKDINGVYLGKENYLIEKYVMSDFDEELVTDNIWYLSEFLKDMTGRYGSEHVQCLLVPSKGTVLTDLLPEHAVAFDTSFVAEQLQEGLEAVDENSAEGDIAGEEISECAVLDLTEQLSEHSAEYIYYRTDHHWTTLGAWYAYVVYKTMRGEQAPALDMYEVTMVTDAFYGTTYDKVQMKNEADSIYVYNLPALDSGVNVDFDNGEMVWDSYYDESCLLEKDKYSYFFGGNTAKIRITTGAGNGKCLLLLKDSFSNSFVEFLEPDYEYIYMIDLRYASEDIYTLMDEINREHQISDVLVMYNTEKLMQDDNLWKLEK